MRPSFPTGLATGLLVVATLLLGAGCPHVCDSHTCPDGCCAADGTCWVDNTYDKCGLDGRTCRECDYSAQTCTLGQCVNKCNASNCPNGCCTSTGSCWTSLSTGFCGKGGAACRDCYDTNQRCTQSGTCGTCGDYGDSCTSNAQCCIDYTCQYDSFYGYSRCKY